MKEVNLKDAPIYKIGQVVPMGTDMEKLNDVLNEILIEEFKRGKDVMCDYLFKGFKNPIIVEREQGK